MVADSDFITRLESKVAEQLRAQRVGYLLGAGSSYLNGTGYPLASELWHLIKDRISDSQKRADIQAKLDGGASGLEQALDLLDDGGSMDTPYRHFVTIAIAELFRSKAPSIDRHCTFVRRLSTRKAPGLRLYSLNYDPMIERAAEAERVRLFDGFIGTEHAFFEPAIFEERIGQIRGSHRGRQFDETVKPLHLLKLHGSLGWYECPHRGVRRCAFDSCAPTNTKLLMIPPQRRKANDTMTPPYAALWSAFRASLIHGATPLNRLVCIGYGFTDEHVNAAIESALIRSDFTLLILTRVLSDSVWKRWNQKPNAIIVTESRSSLKGTCGTGHSDLWSFERLCNEV